MQAIWKDFVLTAAGDAVDYTVYLAGAAVYTGKAYRRPGAAQIEWTINSIAADFLRNEFPALPSTDANIYTTEEAAGLKTFTVVAGGVTTAVEFVNDWSFEEVTDNVWRQMLQIFDTVDARLPLVFTKPYTGNRQLNEIRVRTTPQDMTGGGLTWYLGRATCWRWALYFLNAFGGWSFVYLEAVTPGEDYARKTAKHLYRTNDPTARGTVNYVNQVTKRWTAKTPYLTDEQAAKIWHLNGTPAAVLYDMATGSALPVNVTDGSWEQQTYRRQGAKRPRYDITLELAQDRIRRN